MAELLKYINNQLSIRCKYSCRYIIDEDRDENICCDNCHREAICDSRCTIKKLKITNRQCDSIITTED